MLLCSSYQDWSMVKACRCDISISRSLRRILEIQSSRYSWSWDKPNTFPEQKLTWCCSVRISSVYELNRGTALLHMCYMWSEKAHKMNLLHKNAALEDDLILLSDLSQPDVHHDVHTLLEKQPLRLITLPHHLERSTSPPCDTEELLDRCCSTSQLTTQSTFYC